MYPVPIIGIPSDSNARRLSQTKIGELIDCLIGKSSTPRNHPDPTFFMNKPRHDSNFAFIRGNHTRAFRTDETTYSAVQGTLDPDHVVHGNPFGDTYNQPRFLHQPLPESHLRQMAVAQKMSEVVASVLFTASPERY